MVGPDLLERIDRILAELAELRAELAGAGDEVSTTHLTPADDLLDSFACQQRFGHPADTIRKWARETAGTEQAIAIRSGGRWLVDPRKLRARINGQ